MHKATQYYIQMLDPELIKTTRQYVPLYNQRRFDIYGDVSETVQENEEGQATKK
jgi:hypothetical protein